MKEPFDETTGQTAFFRVGDPVTVSIGPNILALARGFVLEPKPDEVILGIDQKLDIPSLQERVAREPSGTHQGGHTDEIIFSIDKGEMFGGMARVRRAEQSRTSVLR